ncbi:hypothetical protein STEG23_022282, partial [Scotinomys teguina]
MESRGEMCQPDAKGVVCNGTQVPGSHSKNLPLLSQLTSGQSGKYLGEEKFQKGSESLNKRIQQQIHRMFRDNFIKVEKKNYRTGSACHTTTLPALVRTPTLVMQPSLDIKPFMSFPVDSSSAVGLFPNFNT